jgi:Tfp pilus assembly protein PilO
VNRRLVIIAAGVLLGLLSLWFIMLWGPQGGRLQDAKDRATAADTVNSGLELRLARLQTSQERAPELQADVEQLRRAVPDGPELAEFILDANQAASDAGVDFLSISPALPKRDDATLPPVIPLSINVAGSYFSVLDYLDRLTTLPRVVVVDSLALSPGELDIAGTQDLRVALTGRMFATDAPQIPEPVTTTTAPSGGGTTTTTAPAAS